MYDFGGALIPYVTGPSPLGVETSAPCQGHSHRAPREVHTLSAAWPCPISYGCFYKFGVNFLGVLITRAPTVSIEAPDFWKLPHRDSEPTPKGPPQTNGDY